MTVLEYYLYAAWATLSLYLLVYDWRLYNRLKAVKNELEEQQRKNEELSAEVERLRDGIRRRGQCPHNNDGPCGFCLALGTAVSRVFGDAL